MPPGFDKKSTISICKANEEYENQEKPDIFNTTTIITDIYVFLDTTWPYYSVVNYLNYVLQNLNINPFASSVTILAASDGTPIVNTTNYINEVYANWNETTHSKYNSGFKFPIILNTIRDLIEDKMNTERQLAKPGGQSLIALIMPSPVAYVSESDERYCLHFLDNLNYTLPDINILFYAGGAVIRFKSFVWDPEDDLFLLSLDDSVERSAEPVVKRIRKEPRRITNPHCGADWQPNKSAMNAMMQTVRPGGINFYRMAPNYFFDRKSMRYIQVDANNAVTVTVCFSREVRYPHREGSLIPANQDCRQITSLSQSYDLTDACTGYDTILQCPPLYMSVQAQTFADPTQVSCTDADCRSPDQVRYTIFVNNLTCNAAIRIRLGYLNALSIVLIVLCIFNKIF